MSKFLELDEKYTSAKFELSDLFNGFAEWLSDLHDDFQSGYSIGWNEKYEHHHITANCEVQLTYEYKDCYDGCDTSTVMYVPLSWVEAYMNGEQDSIEDEVKKAIAEKEQTEYDRHYNYIRSEAARLGLLEG